VFDAALRRGRIGRLELPNRIIMGSMHLGIEGSGDGERLAAFYVERVRGGAALIVTGGAAVSRVGAGGRSYGLINEDAHAAAFARVSEAVHAAGGRIALQLFHAGRYAFEAAFGLRPVAPSEVPSRFSRCTPRALSEDEILETIDDFARGARRARELGYDAVEIMGSEGYLPNQFLSPFTNRRDDAWGGDATRRMRFSLELVRAIRRSAGDDYPVIFRMSGADLIPDSTTPEETSAFAARLAGERVDALNVGIGWHESSTPTVQGSVPPGAWVPYAEAVKAAAGDVPVIASNRVNTLELADEILAAGRVDFISMARPFLADAAIVRKSSAGGSSLVNVCIACNQACLDRSIADEDVSCMVNPHAVRERELGGIRAAVAPRRFAVIGGGPAGLEAARVLARLGHDVTLFEADAELGGQFRLARRIPGKRDFNRTIEYFAGELARLGVDVELGRAIGERDLAELQAFEGVVLASGVVPRPIDIPGAELPHVTSYASFLRGTKAWGESVAIIGAGGIGVDVARLVCEGPAAAKSIVLLRRAGRIGERIGRSTRWVVMQELRERGVEMLTGIRYERIVPEGLRIVDAEGRARLIPAQTIVVAAGQLRNDALRASLVRHGIAHRIVGGARDAAELDAVRAFYEGMRAAYELGAGVPAAA
jgi:2,4-dienoyl-CoA reductase (NADPH2)